MHCICALGSISLLVPVTSNFVQRNLICMSRQSKLIKGNSFRVFVVAVACDGIGSLASTCARSK